MADMLSRLGRGRQAQLFSEAFDGSEDVCVGIYQMESGERGNGRMAERAHLLSVCWASIIARAWSYI